MLVNDDDNDVKILGNTSYGIANDNLWSFTTPYFEVNAKHDKYKLMDTLSVLYSCENVSEETETATDKRTTDTT